MGFYVRYLQCRMSPQKSTYLAPNYDENYADGKKSKNYENVVQKIVTKNKGLYFNNEIFVIEKK